MILDWAKFARTRQVKRMLQDQRMFELTDSELEVEVDEEAERRAREEAVRVAEEKKTKVQAIMLELQLECDLDDQIQALCAAKELGDSAHARYVAQKDSLKKQLETLKCEVAEKSAQLQQAKDTFENHAQFGIVSILRKFAPEIDDLMIQKQFEVLKMEKEQKRKKTAEEAKLKADRRMSRRKSWLRRRRERMLKQ